MHNNQNQLLDKTDTNQFIKRSNKLLSQFIFYAFKNIFRPKQFKRYIAKAKSIKRNKKLNNYPNDFLSSNKRKVAIYTALFGDYDKIKQIKVKNPFCDYYIFTDQKLPNNCDWQLKEYNFSEDISDNPILKNRFLKMHPHLLFPDYEYSIYIDAAIIIELDIMRLMSRIGNNHLALFKHHAGIDCSYEEANRVKRIGIASQEIVDKQMNRYEIEGFPKHFGFYECSIIVRKHNENDCISIMDTWWKEFLNESKRDQLSFMYSVWKNDKTVDNISSLGLTFWIEPILSGVGHKIERKKNANQQDYL